MDYTFPLIVGWSNVAMAMTNFVLLSLPDVGTVGLYEAYSPYCAIMIDSKSADSCTTAESQIQDMFGPSFTCANGMMLGFGTSKNIWLPVYADWAYALLIAGLLFCTLWKHILIRIPTKPQMPDIAGRIMRQVISISLGLAILSWVWAYVSSAEGSIGVCPGISNSTAGPIANDPTFALNCICVPLRMPGHVASISEVLSADSRTAGRFIFDLI
jgi:hypothetical protein